ncbi:MAG: substrate-binding domain-containing protein [Prevotella sp.]|nr:substrate-binding domain-containing protein [Prevotella sp.]MDD7273067.1 substrate-binding domain-containing protein [Prevotellaceae bacterium]MDY3935764.1 substrate-binding domain-containing protein [Prevotella sp.]MDY4217690.1 substrate-binding domain-containing protein [Prevotella sp.]
MNRSTFYIIVGFILSLSFFSSCGEKKRKDGRTDTPISGTIKFAADESFSPFIEEELQVYQYRYPQTHLLPVYTDDNAGMKMLLDLKVNLFFTSHGLQKGEDAILRGKGPIPSVFPVGYDGIALIINKSNLDSCITVNDVKRLLTGEVTKWNQLYPHSDKGAIEVVFDNKASATLHFVVDSILEGKNIKSQNIVAAKNSKSVIDYVHKTPNAIGVIGSNWLNDKRDTTNVTFKKDIRVMAISKADVATDYNSWQPYQAYLLDGRYPFVRTIYAIVADPHKALPWAFANFVAGPIGQKIIFKTGLLPYRANINIREVEVKQE